MGASVPITNDVVDIPVQGMFASADWRVICKDGEYFYKACSAKVRDKSDGGVTYCIKPLYHPSVEHEDFDGTTRYETFKPDTIEHKTQEHLRKVLRAVGLEPEQAYNVINALTAECFKVTREAP